MYFVEGPDGQMIPLEGEDLQRVRESAWANSPTEFADAYIDYDVVERVEFLKFTYYLSPLIWLHRTVKNATEAIDARYKDLRASGDHLVAGWEGESELILDEELGILRSVQIISSGSIVAAAAAALETLITDLLDPDENKRLYKKGLTEKFNSLMQRLPSLRDAEAIRADLGWVVARRNSFAHSLLDEVGPSWRDRKPFTFDDDTVEESFTRVGRVAESLAIAWNEHIHGSGQ